MAMINELITQYLLELQRSQFQNTVLTEMEEYAKQKNFPIIGPLVGNFLSICAKMIGAKKVLELGSGYGYSAFWFAIALGSEGEIVCIDGDQKNKELAEQYFQKAKLETKIHYKIGDALTIANTLKDKFDIVFCDIDKHQYPLVIDIGYELLNSGGLLIFDNALWSAKVVDTSVNDNATLGIRELNKKIFSDQRYQASILPLRDGVLIARKMETNSV